MSPSDAKTVIGQPFMELTVVESTNIYAMDRLQANLAAHGAVFFAHHQTAGKGQHGKSWTGEPGNNVAMSVVIECNFLSISHQFPLSVMVAVACYDAFSKHAGDETAIKWPNDIYWRDRKAGGILIENMIRGSKWQGSVIGIGINVNQTVFSELLKNPVSLKQITGKELDPVVFAKEICACLQERFEQLRSGEFENLLRFYNEHLYKHKQLVRLKAGAIAANYTIESVNANGELEVSGGLKDRFVFGEVEWQI